MLNIFLQLFIMLYFNFEPEFGLVACIFGIEIVNLCMKIKDNGYHQLYI